LSYFIATGLQHASPTRLSIRPLLRTQAIDPPVGKTS
jgi:hypothetical protein